jgi:flagellar basal body-associated protein FliL
MSEETQNTNETNDGTWSGLKKTIVGTLSTVITGGGVWLGTTLYGSHDEPKEETKTEHTTPAAAAPVIVNVQQNQENKQKVENGGPTVIRERVIEKPTTTQPIEKPKKVEEESW